MNLQQKITMGQKKLEYSAQMYEGLAVQFEESDPERAAAGRAFAAVNRVWKSEPETCLRWHDADFGPSA